MARHTLPDFIERVDPQPASVRPTALSLVLSLRPSQWTKNLIIFFPLMLAQRLLDVQAVLHAIAAFVIFCALSGVVYLINDIVDREADRRHPVKKTPADCLRGAARAGRHRLGGGRWRRWHSAAAFWLRPLFGGIAASYVVLLALYSGQLKHIVILDVLTIAIGFVLRAAAGAVAVDVPISHWLYVLTILLALFLALSKRRHELVLLADGATSHRRILEEYSPYLLDQMIAVVTASTIVAYAFYTVSPETVQRLGTDRLILTLPFPLYGIFRYLYLVHLKEGGGSPSDMLLTDRPLLLCVASGPSRWPSSSTARRSRRSNWEADNAKVQSRHPSHQSRDRPRGLSLADEPGRLPGRHRQGRRHGAQGEHLVAFLLPRHVHDAMAARGRHPGDEAGWLRPVVDARVPQPDGRHRRAPRASARTSRSTSSMRTSCATSTSTRPRSG